MTKRANPSEIPKPAIRPYPSKYVEQLTLQNGVMLQIRPIRPEDEPEFVRFHTTLSDESVYRRYFFFMNLESRIRHERLTQMCFIDYDRQMALVAERPAEPGDPGEIIGVGRLIKTPGGEPGGDSRAGERCLPESRNRKLVGPALNRVRER